MKTTVPQTALPTQMAKDNRLTTIYSTHVLIPKLGPIATQRYVRQYARLLKDLAVAVELVLQAQAYAKTYKHPVAIPAAPPVANRRDFRFRAPLGAGNEYFIHYVEALQAFASPRPETFQRAVKGLSSTGSVPGPSSDSAAATKAMSMEMLPPESNDVGKGRFEAGGVWPADVAQTLRDDAQFEVAPDGPSDHRGARAAPLSRQRSNAPARAAMAPARREAGR